MARPLLGVGDLVCDLKLLMRARLLFGLYNRLAVPNRFQTPAKLYCMLSLFYLIISLYLFLWQCDSLAFYVVYLVSRYMYLIFNILCSLFTEDKYIISVCNRINLTDVTVDSAIIFSRMERKVIHTLIAMIVGKIVTIFIYNIFLLSNISWDIVTNFVQELWINFIFLRNILVFSVLSSRLFVLRLKLERYGFRSLRHCGLGSNNYCDMYTRIMEELHENMGTIKTMVSVDVVFTTISIICTISFNVTVFTNNWVSYITVIFTIIQELAPVLVYCVEMESAAVHVEAIREFTVTELMKQPCERSRRAMLELLAVTAAAPARVSLCRAVHVDARLALAVMSFCSARVILLLQTIRQ